MLSPAPKSDVQTVLQQIKDNKLLSPASLKRLTDLVDFIDEQSYINYATAYALLFPKSVDNPTEKVKADKAFNKFRKTLCTVTEEQNMPLILHVDSNKTSDNNSRHLWFECEDNIKQRVAIYNESYIENLPETLEEQSISIGDGVFRYLLMYAEQDKVIAYQLHDSLQTQLQISHINWKMLDYHDIPIGDHTQQTRQRYFREANFILLLLSPDLIAELMDNTPFKDSALRKIPLALKNVSTQQLKAIAFDAYSIFTDSENKSWKQRKEPKKQEWVENATEHMVDAMQTTEEQHRRKYLTRHLENCRPKFEQGSKEDYIYQHFQTTQPDSAKEAIPYLMNWLSNQNDEVFCAIFGELGMGKTTLCQRLTQELLAKRKQNLKLPFPIYFDLRTVNTLQWDWKEGVPPLETIIENALSKIYNLSVDAVKISVDDIKRIAQQQGGLIIFDGLDEVMNRLTPDQSNAFIQQLWGILPPHCLQF